MEIEHWTIRVPGILALTTPPVDCKMIETKASYTFIVKKMALLFTKISENATTDIYVNSKIRERHKKTILT
jgi:hypothetical protein